MREIGNISILGNLTWDLEVAGYNPGVEPPTSIHNIDVEQELFMIRCVSQDVSSGSPSVPSLPCPRSQSIFYVLPIISGDQGLWKSSNQNKIKFSQINFPFKLDWLACCKAKCWIYGRFRRTHINFCGMRCDVHRQLLCYFVLSQTKINLMSMQDTI